MIFVTGANGNFARAVIRNLLAAGHASSLAVGTRDPNSDFAHELAGEGVKVAHADFDDPASLRSALAGVEKMLIIPTYSANNLRLRQNLNALEAAQAAGVRHVVYASFVAAESPRVEHSRMVHLPTEQAILDSGLAFTILRHALYSDIFLPDLLQTLNAGVLQRAGGAARVAYIARADLGISAARVLADDGHEGRTYVETMEQTISGEEVAALIGEVFEKPVSFRSVPADEWAMFMHENWGVPLDLAQSSVSTMEAVEEGEFDIASDDFATITGHPPRDFRTFLEQVRDGNYDG